MFLHISKYSWVHRGHIASINTRKFLRQPWAGGVVLLTCVIIAMLLANMEWSAHAYHELLTTDLSMVIHAHDNSFNLFYPKNMTVERFVNDALMVIFFFGVGLEIKREVMEGELSSLKKATLPILAAVGGMLAPAIIYLAFNNRTPVEMGWGVPMATDIAFAIAVLSMMGSKVPPALKIFLTALAIADDLGAIIVIALFYGGAINYIYLLIALMVMLGVYIMNKLGESRMTYYLIPAVVIWSLFYYSGVHATMSGVVMAMLIPTKPRYSKSYFLRHTTLLENKIAKIMRQGSEQSTEDREQYHELLGEISQLSKRSIPMTARLEELLAPYITYFIMPIFALVNGGVMINSEHFNIVGGLFNGGGSIGLGIILGLLLGKPIGIFVMSWLAVRFKLAARPSNSTWLMLFGVACLGGIGFTMSIFVDTLAFLTVNIDYVNQGKVAIIIGSLASALLGVVIINLASRRER